MNTLIIYYSYGGNTRKYANDLAKSENADIFEIKDKKRLGMLKTYFVGCFKALNKKTLPIEPVNIDFDKFDKFIVCSPIWARCSTPQINNVFDLLPKGKEIELHMISSSGESAKDVICEWLEEKELNIVKYIDIKI